MKNLKLIIGILVLGTISGAGIFAENKTGFSLQEAVDFALEYSSRVKNARLDINIAQKKIWETTALGLPQINATVSYQDMTQIPTTLIPAQIFDPDAKLGEFIEMRFGTQHNATVEVMATQLVFQGSYFVALRASRTFLQLSKNNLLKSKIDVKEMVSKTYYIIVLGEETRKNLQANLENIDRTLFETSELHKAGFAEDTDVDQLKITKIRLENSLRSINRQIESSYELLKFQMGYDLSREIELTENLDQVLAEINPSSAGGTKLEIEKHIDFQIASTQERAQLLTLKKEQSDHWPNVSAYVTHRQSAMRDKFNFLEGDEKWFPSTVIGININIPIFASGAQNARIQQAKMELKKARNMKKDVISGLQIGHRKAKSDFYNSREKLKYAEENQRLAERILEKTREKLKRGITSSFEFTQIYSQYLTAQADYINAAFELLNAKLALDKAVSKL
jgi:outer membrane protein TolC